MGANPSPAQDGRKGRKRRRGARCEHNAVPLSADAPRMKSISREENHSSLSGSTYSERCAATRRSLDRCLYLANEALLGGRLSAGYSGDVVSL
jgi:hypothetical protein